MDKVVVGAAAAAVSSTLYGTLVTGDAGSLTSSRTVPQAAAEPATAEPSQPVIVPHEPKLGVSMGNANSEFGRFAAIYQGEHGLTISPELAMLFGQHERRLHAHRQLAVGLDTSNMDAASVPEPTLFDTLNAHHAEAMNSAETEEEAMRLGDIHWAMRCAAVTLAESI